MNKIFCKAKKGFTLIEVTIAMAIIMVVAVSFYKSAFIVIKSTNTDKERTEAMLIAQNYLEEIKGKGNIDEYKGIVDKLVIQNDTKYKVTIDIDDKNKNLVQILVNVKPKDTNSVQLGTKLYIRDK